MPKNKREKGFTTKKLRKGKTSNKYITIDTSKSYEKEKKKQTKDIIFALSCILILLITLLGGSYAFFK